MKINKGFLLVSLLLFFFFSFVFVFFGVVDGRAGCTRCRFSARLSALGALSVVDGVVACSSLGARISEGGEPRLRLVLDRRAAAAATGRGCLVGTRGLGAGELEAHVVERRHQQTLLPLRALPAVLYRVLLVNCGTARHTRVAHNTTHTRHTTTTK